MYDGISEAVYKAQERKYGENVNGMPCVCRSGNLSVLSPGQDAGLIQLPTILFVSSRRQDRVTFVGYDRVIVIVIESFVAICLQHPGSSTLSGNSRPWTGLPGFPGATPGRNGWEEPGAGK